jgi:hypothetical protein
VAVFRTIPINCSQSALVYVTQYCACDKIEEVSGNRAHGRRGTPQRILYKSALLYRIVHWTSSGRRLCLVSGPCTRILYKSALLYSSLNELLAGGWALYQGLVRGFYTRALYCIDVGVRNREPDSSLLSNNTRGPCYEPYIEVVQKIGNGRAFWNFSCFFKRNDARVYRWIYGYTYGNIYYVYICTISYSKKRCTHKIMILLISIILMYITCIYIYIYVYIYICICIKM